MRNCAFLNCTNGTWINTRWQEEDCPTHHCRNGTGKCDCIEPVLLFCFPTERRDKEGRQRWTKLVNRKAKNGKNWQPAKDSRVCGRHFVDGEPSPNNPDPTLHLGYVVLGKRPAAPRKLPGRKGDPNAKRRRSSTPNQQETASATVPPDIRDHMNYTFKCDCSDDCQCDGCRDRHIQILKLRQELHILQHEKDCLERKVAATKQPFTSNTLKTDKQVKSITGLPTRKTLDNLFAHVEPRAKKMTYWRGKSEVAIRSTKVKRKFTAKSPKRQGRKRKLPLKEEFVLVLMKLRLAVTMDFLATLFEITKSSCSQIFNTWIKLLAKELKPLVFWPERDVIRQSQPPQIKVSCPNLRSIIDCTEIFIERPRHLRLQALTWSDYKHHNTAKVLYGISPNGMITFVSKAWGGRASDRHIVHKSGFLEKLDCGDRIMADRGFPIQNDLILRQCTLEIPPASSGQEQMTKAKVLQTKKVANIRIHVERAIGRVKWFTILRHTLPISLIPLIDDIIIVCSALSNLLPPLISKLNE